MSIPHKPVSPEPMSESMSDPVSTTNGSSDGAREEAPNSPRLLYWSEYLIAPTLGGDAGDDGSNGPEVDRAGRQLMRSTLSMAGTILTISPSSRDVLGYESTEICGKCFFDLVHPGDRADVVAFLGHATHHVETVRYRIRKKEGDFIWLESAFRNQAEPDGQPTLQVVSHDVTDQYRVEHALRRELDFSALVLESADVHVIVADRDGRIVRCNRPSLWNAQEQGDEIIGRRVFELMPDHSAAHRSELSFLSLDARDFPNDGGRYWGYSDGTASVEWHNSAIIDVDGNVEFVVGIGVDPTEQRQLEYAVLRTLEEERRRIGQDLHDGLGQLLVGISMIGRSFAEQLAKDNNPEATRATELVELAKRADDMAHGIARGLIPIGDDQRGLSRALQCLAADIERIFRVRCQFRMDGDVEEIGHDAANDLFFIAQEAVSNAIKHAHAQTIDIRLVVDEVEIRLSVENDGQPIPDQHAQPVPGPLNNACLRAGGLGTDIMRYRGRRLGGTLAIDTSAIGNTVVQVRVPR